MDERIVIELVRQLSYQNRLNVSRELFKTGYYSEEDYIYELTQLARELNEGSR